MSRSWFSSVIHSEPSSTHSVVPAPSISFITWFGPSFRAPDLSSIRIVVLLAFGMRRMHPYGPASQTVNIQVWHEYSEWITGARPARRLRVRGAPPVVHQGGRRA